METIRLTSYAVNGDNLGYEEESYVEGTFETLKTMPHPALSGIAPKPNAVRWDFYCFETGEMLPCNENGPVEAR